MIPWIITPLAVAGLVISLYFTFAYYGRVKNARWIPELFCAREGSSCVTVVQTPYARVFGVPNSLLGIFYYLGLILWPVTNWIPTLNVAYGGSPHVLRPPVLLLSASAVTVFLGFYLVYALRRKLHIDCPLCYTAHAINLVIFVLLVILSGSR
jgi:uncharacterized membrane protein